MTKVSFNLLCAFNIMTLDMHILLTFQKTYCQYDIEKHINAHIARI
jgi:hypothetical protein